MLRMALAQITWQDVQQLPDDGNRYEAIDGELCVTPAPSGHHQRISMRLTLLLHRLLVEPGLGELLYAPTGVEFPATEEGVQPDLLFVSNQRRGILADPWIRGAPDLVVEILSPTTAHRDRGVSGSCTIDRAYPSTGSSTRMRVRSRSGRSEPSPSTVASPTCFPCDSRASRSARSTSRRCSERPDPPSVPLPVLPP